MNSENKPSSSTVFIASDHAGFSVKSQVMDTLANLGLNVTDLGPSNDERVDYPDYANKVCERVLQTADCFGVLICGSGQGMAMRANKFQGIRAALCWSEEVTQLAREHNNANVLCLGARVLTEQQLNNICQTFFTSPFTGGRHQGRVEKISHPTIVSKEY